MREIVVDTETTGLGEGHRIVEIAAIELRNKIPTGNRFHTYLDPKRTIDKGATAVHGLTREKLAGSPTFKKIAGKLTAFLGDSPLVIHNAAFDVRFLNDELTRAKLPPLTNPVVDTIELAKRKWPRANFSLTAICKRLAIDTSARLYHGALLDAELLAEVYLHLSGGRQIGFDLSPQKQVAETEVARVYREPRQHAPTPDELAAHEAFIAKMEFPIWRYPRRGSALLLARKKKSTHFVTSTAYSVPC